MIYLNNEPVNVTLFPDNTSQVWKLDEKHLDRRTAIIKWEYSHEGEVMHIAQLKMLLDNTEVEWVTLEIDFLPYGRQDKSILNNNTFALHTFAKIINSLKFDRVLLLDPHSKMATAVILNALDHYPHQAVQRAYQETRSDLVCYPDKGAVEKYTQIYHYKNIHGEKVRDQATGYITHYTLIGRPIGNRVLIIDDICDGGKTFEILTKDLYEAGAEEVNLFVTHGIFSKGLRPLKNVGIKRIFTHKGEAIIMPDGELGYRKDWMNETWYTVPEVTSQS